MRAANHGRNEQRLAALRRYDILDTDREDAFDEITELVARICDVPVAVVSLVEDDRQWFKSEVGIGASSTPIEQSICAHAILHGDFIEIEDTLLDSRTRDNPLCTGEDGFRFYAGTILATTEGLPLGTLCVLDRVPRRLTDVQRDTIRVLGTQVMRQLDLRLALKRQDVLRREIDHRVKNSLQSVGAIISLQAAKSANPEVTVALDTVHRRLNAIVVLHEEMHRGGDDARVALGGFIERMAVNMVAVCPPGVSIDADVAPIDVDAAEASAIGMIVNEFVANAVKHAYPDGRGGTIRIAGVSDGDMYRLSCSDGGIGLADAANVMRRGRGLGLRIIAASASALGTTPMWSSGPAGLTLDLAFGKMVTPTGGVNPGGD